MNQELKKLVHERMSQLPKVVVDSIQDSQWKKEIRDIVSKNNLLIGQGLVLERETLLMMLGVENPKDFTKNIRKHAELSNEEAIVIAHDVNERVLKKIKEKLIEETEKEEGFENNPLSDVLGPRKEIEENVPDIDLTLDDQENYEEDERQSIVKELEADIKIEDENFEDEEENEAQENEEGVLEEINEQEKEWVEEAKEESEKPKPQNKIEILGDNQENPRVIESFNNNHHDDLPSLEPLRTLDSDSEGRDEIVNKKMGESTIKKTSNEDNQEDGKTEKEESEIPKKNDGPDPYREPIE